ncbi:UNVERIFIED_CONTAM: hypothetical protein FKN15_015171 [Acipenser sinensis]
MFQLPVVNLDKIRKSRKRVKEVLCDIGLEHCKELLEPRYRSNTFCCSLCKFCTKRLCTYKAHILRCHEEDEDLETLAGCPVCPFASHPKVINQHFRIFHTMPRKNLASQSVPSSDPTPLNAVDRFSCRKCFFQDSLYYCMKKHILVSHYPTLLNSYYGQRSENEIQSCRESGIPPLKFYCKICNLPADSSEALLYHILTSDKHRELEIHLKALIHENTKTGKRNQMRVPQIAPKVKESHQVLKLSMLPGTSGQQQQQQQHSLLFNYTGFLILLQSSHSTPCPMCNELFPSNVYQVHIGIAHKQSPTNSSNAHRLAARAPFLKKIKDKTLKCLLCKTLISEKGLFEHLLHGLNCLYCPAMFSSVKQLVEHTNSEHNTKQKVNGDFMNKEYRLYTDDHGELVFPYFDLNTAASKEQVGDKEVHLALVTGTLEVIYIKVHIEAGRPVCRITQKAQTKDCPFCPEKFESSEEYELHLKMKHHIMPTIHTILKTPAFKCIYCCGVYTGKTTSKAISVHVQRCRCAPKNTKDLEKTFSPDCSIPTVVSVNGGSQRLVIVPMKQDSQMTSNSKADNPVFQSNLRLKVATRDSADASARERELIATKRKRIDSDGGALSSAQEEPLVHLELDPTGFEMRAYEARKEFLNDYFNKKPYLSKNEVEVLASRLWINKTDVACHFGSKRTRCLKTIQKNKAVVLLGFNMCELKKVKHDLNVAELNDD